jgi:hypothetical protein
MTPIDNKPELTYRYAQRFYETYEGTESLHIKRRPDGNTRPIGSATEN